MNMETKIENPSPTEDKGIERREFIKTTRLAAVGLGAGLGAIESLANAAQDPPAGQPGGPYPADFQKIHDRLIVIDAFRGAELMAAKPSVGDQRSWK